MSLRIGASAEDELTKGTAREEDDKEQNRTRSAISSPSLVSSSASQSKCMYYDDENAPRDRLPLVTAEESNKKREEKGDKSDRDGIAMAAATDEDPRRRSR
ncbi:hypothetical protein ZIOFF_015146 [Zingiber officinale]|uniref:Uncharacterized protein n=1 Tax=Zingiber officinale TaxID=94328 RepID=A0A8J5LT43_ZINOF|nr:hypothetical protein ZIOFF_015146 [Zingiber officinale]